MSIGAIGLVLSAHCWCCAFDVRCTGPLGAAERGVGLVKSTDAGRGRATAGVDGRLLREGYRRKSSSESCWVRAVMASTAS